MIEIFPGVQSRAEDRVLGLGYTGTFPATLACFPDTVFNSRKPVYFLQTFWKVKHSFKNASEETLSFFSLNVC